jgi:hypothetical protein
MDFESYHDCIAPFIPLKGQLGLPALLQMEMGRSR